MACVVDALSMIHAHTHNIRGAITLKRYRVEVVQTNVFFEEAESETEARRIAAEDRIWDEDQRAPDYYGVHFNVEEAE